MGLIQIKFDGACRNIKGESNTMGIGVAVFFDGCYMEEESIAVQVIPEYIRGTSNVAEWEACVYAWKVAVRLNELYPNNKVEIYSDSQIISNQFNDDYNINEPSYLTYYRTAKSFQSKFRGVKASNYPTAIKWIRREFNKEADKLSKIGLQGEGGKAKELGILLEENKDSIRKRRKNDNKNQS